MKENPTHALPRNLKYAIYKAGKKKICDPCAKEAERIKAAAAEPEELVPLDGSLMDAYYLYSAMLLLKLVALAPLSMFSEQLDEKVTTECLRDLKDLLPFWVVCGFYVATEPDITFGITLIRIYYAARIVIEMSYDVKDQVPEALQYLAFFLSHAITAFMGIVVAFTYKGYM